jgi:hypothetical protein
MLDLNLVVQAVVLALQEIENEKRPAQVAEPPQRQECDVTPLWWNDLDDLFEDDTETRHEQQAAQKLRHISPREKYERTRCQWTDDEIATLRIGVQMDRSNQEISDFLGRTVESVGKQKRRVFGSGDNQ